MSSHAAQVATLYGLRLRLCPHHSCRLTLAPPCPPASPPQIADLTFVLTPDEIDNRLTMLCMSRPVSDVVYVETQVRCRPLRSSTCRCCAPACAE